MYLNSSTFFTCTNLSYMDFYKLHYILLAYKIFCKYSFDLKIIINIRAFGEKMISRFIILVNML